MTARDLPEPDLLEVFAFVDERRGVAHADVYRPVLCRRLADAPRELDEDGADADGGDEEDKEGGDGGDEGNGTATTSSTMIMALALSMLTNRPARKEPRTSQNDISRIITRQARTWTRAE